MAKCIMEFQIRIKGNEVSAMESDRGKVVFIPFDGSVESDIFTGEILPGAADVQVTNASGIRHMCARYMFKGKDTHGMETDCCPAQRIRCSPQTDGSHFPDCPFP